MNGLIALAVVVAGFALISALAEERNKWMDQALSEGQAHRATKSILSDVQQQLQATLAEVNVLRKKMEGDGKKA